MNDIKARVREFIAENFLLSSPTIGDGDSLIDGGVIDSTGILELVTFIEKDLGIAVADDDIVPENLGSIAAIAAYVERRKVKPAGASG